MRTENNSTFPIYISENIAASTPLESCFPTDPFTALEPHFPEICNFDAIQGNVLGRILKLKSCKRVRRAQSTPTFPVWNHSTSGGGAGLNFATQVRLMVEPRSTCMSGPPRISVCGSEKEKKKLFIVTCLFFSFFSNQLNSKLSIHSLWLLNDKVTFPGLVSWASGKRKEIKMSKFEKTKETTLERADFTPQLSVFVTAKKKMEMFIIFFLSSVYQLLSPWFKARIGWARPDHESSDQPA